MYWSSIAAKKSISIAGELDVEQRLVERLRARAVVLERVLAERDRRRRLRAQADRDRRRSSRRRLRRASATAGRSCRSTAATRVVADRQAQQAAVVAGVRELRRAATCGRRSRRRTARRCRAACCPGRTPTAGSSTAAGSVAGGPHAIARRAAGLHAAEQAEREAVVVRSSRSRRRPRRDRARRSCPARSSPNSELPRHAAVEAELLRGTGCPPRTRCSCTRSRTGRTRRRAASGTSCRSGRWIALWICAGQRARQRADEQRRAPRFAIAQPMPPLSVTSSVVEVRE